MITAFEAIRIGQDLINLNYPGSSTRLPDPIGLFVNPRQYMVEAYEVCFEDFFVVLTRGDLGSFAAGVVIFSTSFC